MDADLEECRDILEELLADDCEAPFHTIEELEYSVDQLTTEDAIEPRFRFAQVPPMRCVKDVAGVPFIPIQRHDVFKESIVASKPQTGLKIVADRLESLEAVLLFRIEQLEELYFSLKAQITKHS